MSAMVWILVALLAAGAAAWAVRKLLRSRNMHLWIGSYLRRARRMPPPGRITHVHFAFCDHYEPYWRKADTTTARQRVTYQHSSSLLSFWRNGTPATPVACAANAAIGGAEIGRAHV